MGLDARQLLYYVIRPALRVLGERYATSAAERLVLGTAAVESVGLRFIHQLGNGPALGLWQMEPVTFRDHWRVGGLIDRYNLREKLLSMSHTRARVVFADGMTTDQPTPIELCSNLALGAAMCRVHYLRDPKPLPGENDVFGMAETWKRAYNTVAGAGTVDGFRQFYNQVVTPILTR